MIAKIKKYFLMVLYKIKKGHQKNANISFLRDLGSLLGAMLVNSNSTIWWVLNTAGFSRRDATWLIFFISLALVSPWFCLFIITRLLFILIITRICVFIVDSFAYTVKTFDISDRKTVSVLYATLIAFSVIIVFKAQQYPILCQGEKQLFTLANPMIEALNTHMVKVETRVLAFAPQRYTEHIVNSQIFDVMQANFGFTPKRHEQSTFLQLFLAAFYSSYNGEQGAYTHINAHSLLGNSQPGNDYTGKFTFGDKQVLPIRRGYENYNAVFEIVCIYRIVALYDYSRLIDIEANCRRPRDYYYVDPINYSVHIGGVWLQAARSEAVLAYHSGYDKLEPGIPDGLLIEVEFKQDARLRKNKQGEISRGFFDFWPEIPALSQPMGPIEGNTIHRATYANRELVLKNPDKGKKHIEFCKAFQYSEAYYRFGLSFKSSITGEELVFPETFIRLHVFNTNV